MADTDQVLTVSSADEYNAQEEYSSHVNWRRDLAELIARQEKAYHAIKERARATWQELVDVHGHPHDAQGNFTPFSDTVRNSQEYKDMNDARSDEFRAESRLEHWLELARQLTHDDNMREELTPFQNTHDETAWEIGHTVRLADETGARMVAYCDGDTSTVIVQRAYLDTFYPDKDTAFKPARWAMYRYELTSGHAPIVVYCHWINSDAELCDAMADIAPVWGLIP